MKNKILLILFSLFVIYTQAQTANVESAVVDYRNNDLESAKTFIDKAAQNSETKESPKMLYYRGLIHLKLAQDTILRDKYLDASEIALSSFIQCVTFDKKKKYEERIDEETNNAIGSIVSMVNSSFLVFNRASILYTQKDYEGAMRCYDLILQAIPLDKGKDMAKNNLAENQIVQYNAYAAINAKKNARAKELLGKLISASFQDPMIYIQLELLQKSEGDTTAALSTIEKGRLAFPENKDLLNEELRIYQDRNDMGGLVNKLSKSLESDPTNTNFLSIRGSIYDQWRLQAAREKKLREADSLSNLAEADYKKCLEINPNDTFTNYSLGALYLQQVNNVIEKINDLNEKKPDYKTKVAKYQADIKTICEKARPYLEKAWELKDTEYDFAFALMQLYNKLELKDKAEEFKKKKDELRR